MVKRSKVVIRVLSMLRPNMASILCYLCSFSGFWPLFSPNTWRFLPVSRNTTRFWVKLGGQIFRNMRPWTNLPFTVRFYCFKIFCMDENCTFIDQSENNSPAPTQYFPSVCKWLYVALSADISRWVITIHLLESVDIANNNRHNLIYECCMINTSNFHVFMLSF